MKRRLLTLMVGLVLVCVVSTFAYAQGGGSTTASILGVVTDTSGGVLPGASVVVKNSDTGVKAEFITNSAGAFAATALDIGTYEVTVSLSGFKTSVTKDIKAILSQSIGLNIKLEVGSLTDTITVRGGSELVNTTTPTVMSSLTGTDLKALPLPTQNALYALTLLPGVDQTSSTGPRLSTIAGLPQGAINITLDGVNVNNTLQRTTDGFYAMVFPQLDAIEQVTLTTASSGADQASQGGVQIKFVTKSGTNTYRGSAYDYFRHPSLNTNYYFNIQNGLPRNRVIVSRPGASEGGPIVIPGLFDGHGRAFFYFNYEDLKQPTNPTNTRTMLSPLATTGIYQYQTTVNGVVTVNSIDLLALAAANGQTSTIDPTIRALLAEITHAASTTGTISNLTNLNTQQYVYQGQSDYVQHLPTIKVDFNLSNRHRLSGTYIWQVNNADQNGGVVTFPGLPNHTSYTSKRTVGSMSLRSTLSPTFINELVGGWQWSPGYFSSGLSAAQFADQAGFSLAFPLGATSATNTTSGEFPRSTPVWNIDDNVTWLHGGHSIAAGVSFSRFYLSDRNVTVVPNITFGIQTGLDPADAMFGVTSNVPSAEAANARALYAFLTGRVTAINATGRLDPITNLYTYPPSQSYDHARYDEWGTYIQDTWRLSPTLTLKAGLRWEVQMPFQALTNNYEMATFADACGISGVGAGVGGRGCNLFQPGVLTGIRPTFHQYSAGTNGYPIAWGNVAPNVGVAWRPNVQDGFLRTLLGDPDQATIRAGFSIAYNPTGMDTFTSVYGSNPGLTVSANRNNNNGNLTTTWPLLLSNASALGPPPICASGVVSVGCMQRAPIYEVASTIGNSINVFDPTIRLSHDESYSLGIQRALNRDMAVEVQYVGTRLVGGWTRENWNEINADGNGFTDEFLKAQANLVANITAGRGNTFAYTGAPGTSPLPIFLASYLGLGGCVSATGCAGAGDPAKYTGTNWTNSTLVSALSGIQPSLTTFTSNATNGLYGNTTFKNNGIAAGLPVNFWLLNPDAGNVNVTTNGLKTQYDSIQLLFRTRLAHGLAAQANYTIAFINKSSVLDTLHRERQFIQNAAGVPRAFKASVAYQIPVGRGRRFGADMSPWLDGVIGNWSYGLTTRLQSGAVQTLTKARLVGMTQKDLQNEFYMRIDPVTHIVTDMDPDIILNTRRAYSTDPTSPTGYSSLGVPTGRYIAPAQQPGCFDEYPGDCGEPRYISLTGPLFTDFDMSLRKTFPFGKSKKANAQFEVSAINVFDAINFNAVLSTSTSPTQDQVTSAYRDTGTASFNPGGRIGQLVFRVNW